MEATFIMPKQQITKEMVVDAAFEIARNDGMEQVLVKTIAKKVGCSVQPIYSYCKNMEGLRQDVTARTCCFVQKYISTYLDPNDLFRSTGNAYIRFAKEEPHLFRIWILHRRDNICSLQDLYQSESSPHIAKFIANALQIDLFQAKQLHLNMLIYTIGLGTILATTKPGIPIDEIFAQLEIAYQTFLSQSLQKKEPTSNE